MTLDEIQRLSLEGLLLFRKIVEDNNLRYYLAWGSLLGAVRHKGFIPWNDDIDVWMPRKDYNILLSKANAFSTKEWKLMHNSVNHNYLFTWAKFANTNTIRIPSPFVSGLNIGLAIDIFPLENINLPYKEAEEELFSKSAYLDNCIDSYHPSTYDKDIPLLKLFLRRLYFKLRCLAYRPYHETMKEYDDLFIHYDDSSLSVGECMGPKKRIFKKEWFSDSIELEFENESFKAPAKFNEILTVLYGDFMTIPPKGEQISHPNHHIFWKS